MRTRRTFVALIALSLAAVLSPAGGRSAPTASLGAGERVFWNGPFLEEASGKTFTYEVEVTERARRLRIGLDHPEIGDSFTARVFQPGGAQVASFSADATLYSAESIHDTPKLGTWRIEVQAQEVTDSAFRLRAKLEAHLPRVGRGRDLVPPNLQILPPHDASFLMPVTNGTTADGSIGLDTAGAESCHPEEHAEDRAIRCLRFAYGVRNTGRGSMDLTHSGPLGTEHPLIQLVHRADGTTWERAAGTAVYHKTHGHYHHSEAVGLRLFKVVDTKRGKLEAASAKRTKGFAHRNELLREWNRFYPTPIMSGFGLLPGWADIYEWDRPGNYIDFGLNGDGRYVIRMWADPVNGILESNERDNLGYTYLKVTGSKVKLLEAGRGRDPWDRCKIEVGFGGHPDPKQRTRPGSCPPDTT